jgi:hypothetical protein
MAELAIGSSTLRNQGAKGVVRSAREFLKRINLETFRAESAGAFDARLDSATEELRRRLPEGARNWGAARKALNVFLRDVLYNSYLRSRYRFDQIETWLEAPLDRYVAHALLGEAEGGLLPPCPTIKRLTPRISAQYQAAARSVAKRMGTAPVHLDLYYWQRDV